jgi:hypothetical protein
MVSLVMLGYYRNRLLCEQSHAALIRSWYGAASWCNMSSSRRNAKIPVAGFGVGMYDDDDDDDDDDDPPTNPINATLETAQSEIAARSATPDIDVANF